MLISDRHKPVNVKIAPFRQAKDARMLHRDDGTAAKLRCRPPLSSS
jgi:hypothetical protein